MDQVHRKIAVGITGASGSLYAKVLLDRLQAAAAGGVEVGLVWSRQARQVWETELGNKDYENYAMQVYGPTDFNAPFASGSARYDTMIICPCSMGTLGRIASGISNDLMTRAADVILKERRELIMVTRETPLNLIQLRNMVTVTEAGAIVCPATPSFYGRPEDMEEVVATVVDRVLDLAGLPVDTFRWGSVPSESAS